jgi:hypothetical protein
LVPVVHEESVVPFQTKSAAKELNGLNAAITVEVVRSRLREERRFVGFMEREEW